MNLLPQSQTKERRFKIDLTLTPAQQEIERLSKRFTHLRAGRKFGKTMYTLHTILKWLGPANSVVWYISPTYRQGKLISWSTIKRMIPQEALAKKPNDADMMITLKNGSELYYMGSDDPDSLRGPAPTGVIFEEAAYHKPEAWYNVVEPNLAVHKAPALFVSTPRGFNWFKDLEDEAKRLEGLGDSDWATFHYTIYDNPHIDKAEIERIRRSTDPMVWRQEYMAEYESSVGRVFNAFQDTSRHVMQVPMPRTFEAKRAIDWGMRDDCATTWGRKMGNKLHVYREYAENGLGAKTQAGIVLGKTPANESIVRTAISHDAVREDANMQGLTVMWHMMNAGIRPIQPSSKDKQKSRAMLQQLFQEDRIIIDPSCVKLRKQLLSYEWKDTAMEKTADGNDDLVDSLHYLVELFQFDLFMDGRTEIKRTPLELIAAHQKDVEDRMANPFRDHVRGTSEEMILPLDNTPAGYL